MLLDRRLNQQVVADEHRAGLQEVHAWLEKMSRGVESLEAGSGRPVADRLSAVDALATEHASVSPDMLTASRERADAMAREVGDMDRQHLEEQVGSVERRVADLKKRIERKQQILRMAKEGFDETRGEIEATDRWMKEKIHWLQEVLPGRPADKRLEEVAALTKETDSKTLLLESLENKVQAIGLDLEPAERDELQNYLRMLSANQAILAKLTKEVLKREKQMADDRKRVDEDASTVSTWLKACRGDVLSSPDYDPLTAASVEKKATRLKKAEGELKNYEENNMAKLRRSIKNLTKSERTESQPLVAELKELETSFDDFKEKLKARIIDLEGKYDGRKKFEGDADAVAAWLSKAESAVATEMRGTVNIATLDDHLQRFKTLRKEEDETRKLLGQLVERANEMLPTLSDADQLTLQSQMDGLCDKMNHVSVAATKRVEALVQNIDHYRETAAKIEDSVSQLGDIQREIKLLNKPIGHRVEDAEDVLASYEKILNDLKRFKGQLEDLHRTAGTNVSELRALLLQQEELILAIENQMVRIRALISLRHSFMEIVTGITGFIIKYTEVVKEVERSNLSPSEKVRRYDEVLSKIGECEAQLSLAVDKGEQIAAEGTSQDRNKITEQLQSLKSQLQTLRRAIENKRAEHVHTAEEHLRLAAEAEALLDRLGARESEVKSRPLLRTSVDDVDERLNEHARLSDEVKADLTKVAAIRDAAAKEDNLPGSIAGIFNQANALLHTMPQQLEERRQYLENNKELRLQVRRSINFS
jgi:nesprin-1